MTDNKQRPTSGDCLSVSIQVIFFVSFKSCSITDGTGVRRNYSAVKGGAGFGVGVSIGGGQDFMNGTVKDQAGGLAVHAKLKLLRCGRQHRTQPEISYLIELRARVRVVKPAYGAGS